LNAHCLHQLLDTVKTDLDTFAAQLRGDFACAIELAAVVIDALYFNLQFLVANGAS
jgi:hypothetical protein